MKKNVLLVILVALMLVGCGDSVFPELSDDAIAFETKYIDAKSSRDFYCYELEYNGRQYLEYGDTKGFLNKKDIDKCVGYIVQNDDSNKVRVYTLSEDPECNLLIVYVVESEDLITPWVWRAEDTKGKDINLPKYVIASDYYERLWK